MTAPLAPGPPAPAPPAPPPPAGPGVYPPFPAPPVEGKGKRTAWQLGIGGGVVVVIALVVVGVIAGIGVSAQRLVQKEAKAVLVRYLDAIEQRRYFEAYALLCQSKQARQDEDEFADDMLGFDLVSYTLGDLDVSNGRIPVEATFSDNSTEHLTAQLSQEGAGRLTVCGLE